MTKLNCRRPVDQRPSKVKAAREIKASIPASIAARSYEDCIVQKRRVITRRGQFEGAAYCGWEMAGSHSFSSIPSNTLPIASCLDKLLSAKTSALNTKIARGTNS